MVQREVVEYISLKKVTRTSGWLLIAWWSWNLPRKEKHLVG